MNHRPASTEYPEGAWRSLGLTDEEYDRIIEQLGRRPNWVELGMFSVLWSEHCSYKHTRPLFKLFPTSGPRILQGLGENAGVVDIGDGLAVTFKVESHNHPSAVEPYHGAATGVGGILRDVFTMGARPIALLNSLRLGPLDDERVRHLFEGIIAGMSDYGNAVGVPTVGGEIAFDPAYRKNPLVNAMAVGLVRHEDVATASAAGAGNPVMIVGAPTGRDGIHGAAFASTELSDDDGAERPSAQVGDPFAERLLIEACLELIRSGVVVGMQDMGAAGLTSSSSEMAARADMGIEIDLDLVPRREPGMTPFEIMLSETQERMLLVTRKGDEQRVKEICARWGVNAVVVGQVTDDKMLRLLEGGQIVAEVPAKSLTTDGAPVYYPEERQPGYIQALRETPLPDDIQGDAGEALHALLSDGNIADKGWVYRQFDATAQARTVTGPGQADAGIVHLRETGKGLAFAIDGNALHCYVDPFIGAAAAVAEAARNLVCTGAQPLALTDGLNFGSPEKPEGFWQIRRAVEGIAEAAKHLGTPVIGGNVSLYNESDGEAIWPTPIIGMVGLIDRIDERLTQTFQAPGDLIYLIGDHDPSLGGSRYLITVHQRICGPLPTLDLDKEAKVQQATLRAARARLLRSAHDCSEGGLAVTLAESAITAGLGVDVTIRSNHESPLRNDALLFGEGYSRIVVSVSPGDQEAFEALMKGEGVAFHLLGTVTDGSNGLQLRTAGAFVHESLDDLARSWYSALPAWMEAHAGGSDVKEP